MPIEATTLSPPLSTQELLQSLRNFRTALPISNSVKQDVIRSLHHPNTSADRVARAVARDPALSLQIILSTNQLLSSQGLEAKYLGHSISLMGLPKVEQIVRAVPEYKNNNGYEEQLNQCWIAANLAQELKLAAFEEDQEQLFFSCLSMRFHELALWSQYPHKMEQIERLKANPIYDHEQVEQRVLGMTLNDLGKQLAGRWPLPETTRQCWREGFQLTESNNGDYISQTNCIKLCHVVSSLGNRNWYHPETVSALELLAKEARVDTNQVSLNTRQSCIHAPFAGWQPHPAARLLMQWDHQKNLVPLFWESNATKPETTSNAPKPKPSKTAPAPSLEPEIQEAKSTSTPYQVPSELDERLNRLSHRGSSFADLNELLLFTLETLQDTMNANQSMILVLNSDRSHLRFQYCNGADGLSGKSIALTPKQTALFQKLLEKPSSLRISTNNVHQCIAQLSPRLASIFASEHSAMMSLFHNQQPLGIMFLKKPILSTADFTDFKKLGSATNSAIAEVARVRHRRAL